MPLLGGAYNLGDHADRRTRIEISDSCQGELEALDERITGCSMATKIRALPDGAGS